MSVFILEHFLMGGGGVLWKREKILNSNQSLKYYEDYKIENRA